MAKKRTIFDHGDSVTVVAPPAKKKPPAKPKKSVNPVVNPRAKGPVPSPTKNVGAKGALAPKVKAPAKKPAKTTGSVYGLATVKPSAPLAVASRAATQTAKAATDVQKRINAETKKHHGGSGLLTVADYMERPFYGVTAGVHAAAHGKNPLSHAAKGFQGKERVYGSDLLKDAGVHNKLINTVVGTGIDYALDPSTYVSLVAAPETGGASLAALGAKGAVKEGAKVAEKQAVKAEAKAAVRGISVRAKAKVPLTHKNIFDVRTSGKTTRKVAQVTYPVRNAVRKKAETIGTQTIHDFRSPRVNPAAHKELIDAQRQFRAADASRAAEVGRLTKAVHKTSKHKPGSVLHELEAKAPESSPVARDVRKALDSQGQAAKALGVGKLYEPGALLPAKDGTRGDLQKIRLATGKDKKAAVRAHGRARRELDVEKAKLAAFNRRGVTSSPKLKARYENRVADKQRALKAAEQRLSSARSLHAGTKRVLSEPAIGFVARLQKAAEGQHAKTHAVTTEIAQRQATEPARYAPHVPQTVIDQRKGILARSAVKFQRGTGTKPAGDLVRMNRGSIQEQVKAGKNLSQEDAHVLDYAMKTKAHQITAAEYWHKATNVLRKHGIAKDVASANDLKDLGEHGAVYRINDGVLTEVKPKEVSLSGNSKKKSELIKLDRRDYERLKSAVENPIARQTSFGRGYDKIVGGWKYLATVPNPGFHVRNELGDGYNSIVLGGTTLKDHADAARITKSLVQRDRFEKSVRRFGESGPASLEGKVKLGKRELTRKQLLAEAEKQGVLGSGFSGAELERRFGAKDVLTHASQYRENRVRLATYVGGLRSGLSPAEAARKVNDLHFDYAALSPAERGLRRGVVPFYTWAARNMRTQLEHLAKKPGAATNTLLTLDEASKSMGFDNYQEFLKEVPEYLRRDLPVPWGHRDEGKAGGVNIDAQQPLSSLAQLTNPLSGHGLKQSEQYLLRQVTPVVRAPIDVIAGKDLASQFPLAGTFGNKHYAEFPAAGKLPEAARKALGARRFEKNGKWVWGIPVGAKHLLDVVPNMALANKLTQGGQPTSGSTKGQSLFGKATGLTPTTHDPRTVRLNSAFERLSHLSQVNGEIGKQFGGKGGPRGREYIKNAAQIKKIKLEIVRLQKALKQPVTVKVPTGGSGGLGGGGFGGGFGGSGF